MDRRKNYGWLVFAIVDTIIAGASFILVLQELDKNDYKKATFYLIVSLSGWIMAKREIHLNA